MTDIYYYLFIELYKSFIFFKMVKHVYIFKQNYLYQIVQFHLKESAHIAQVAPSKLGTA